MTERFKPLEDIHTTDPRNALLAKLDVRTGQFSDMTVEDHYHAIEQIVLSPRVPEDLQNSFVTAKHLQLYAWYVYRFHAAAQMQALSTLEYALRERLSNGLERRAPTLQPLLKKAIKMGIVSPEALTDGPFNGSGEPIAERMKIADWLEGFSDRVSAARNDLAHGSFTLMPDGARTLRIVADIVNQLYSAPLPNTR